MVGRLVLNAEDEEARQEPIKVTMMKVIMEGCRVVVWHQFRNAPNRAVLPISVPRPPMQAVEAMGPSPLCIPS